MSQLRIDVADLLTHPGARRPLHLRAEVEDLHGSVATVDEPVELDVMLERIPDGIIVRGTVAAHWASECGVCLRGVGSTLELPVAELFEDDPLEGETYPIFGYEIDLEQLVRDAVLLELPLAPVCEGEAAATCAPAGSGEDGAEELAEDEPATDPRWSPLSNLRL